MRRSLTKTGVTEWNRETPRDSPPRGESVVEPEFKVGDRVHLVSNPDSVGVIVDGPLPQRGVFYYQVFFSADKHDTLFPESALDAHEELENFTTAFGRAKFLDRTVFLQFLILEKIRKPLSDNLYTFYASRTDFQVHQFKPVLKFIPSVDQRLFLADEVGLGKTIEAGIILTELQARHQGLTRVLVVCPAALPHRWESTACSQYDVLYGNVFRYALEPAKHRIEGFQCVFAGIDNSNEQAGFTWKIPQRFQVSARVEETKSC